MVREKNLPHVPFTSSLSKKGIHESKIVARFWIIGILLAVLSIVTLKTKMIEKIKNITVLGAGKSGIGAAVLAKKKNIEVVVYNDSIIQSSSKDFLKKHNIKCIEKIQYY